MTINNRIQIAGHLEVTMSNPNGDPDAEGQPRIDHDTGHGFITDVAIKRKVRDYIAKALDAPLLIADGSIINDTLGAVKRADGESFTEAVCRQFVDVRLFGGVISTGDNKDAGNLRGPVQITWAQSLDPVRVLDVGIQRCAATNKKEHRQQQSGRKAVIAYGIYRFDAVINPADAAKTGMTEADLEVLIAGLRDGWDITPAAGRTQVDVRSLVVHRHRSPLGDEPVWVSRARVQLTNPTGDPEARWEQRGLLIRADDADIVETVAQANEWSRVA
jgi:CRISPR-associated protein Csd2